MGPKIAVSCYVVVLFSTVFVYSAAFGQNGDVLYRQLRKKPTLQKELTDQALTDTIAQERIKKLNQQTAEYNKEKAEDDKKLASQPDVPDAPDAEDDHVGKPGPATANTGDKKSHPGEPSLPSRSSAVAAPPPPPTTSTSSDSPKVAFDPMPDEIQFDGDETAKPTPIKKPASPVIKKKR